MKKQPNIVTTTPMFLLKKTAFIALLLSVFTGCTSKEKIYTQTISDKIIADYKKSFTPQKIVFNELKEEKTYTAGDIREIITFQKERDEKEVPLEVISRLAGIPENWHELPHKPDDLTEEQIYRACQVHMKGIRNEKKVIRVIWCSYSVDLEPPFFTLFHKYYYLSADGKTCYGSQIIRK